MKLKVKRSLIYIYIYISVLFIIHSCEYGLKKENYQDIAKPAENHLFDLTLIPEMDTIDIFKVTQLSYNFNAYGLEKKSAEFSIDGKSVEFLSDMKTIGIDPYYYQEGYHILSMIIYTNSGTGSIADVAGAEGYTVEKKWVLYTNSDFTLPIVKTITNDGFLKFSWPKLKVPYFSRIGTTFSYNTTYVTKNITDINNNFYVDSSYVGGTAYFQLSYYFNTNESESIYRNLEVNDSLPTLHFEDISIDSVRVYWKQSPYNVKYKLINAQPSPPLTIIDAKPDTTCKTVQPTFGSTGTYMLYIAPKSKNTTTWNIQSDYKVHGLGKHIANYPDYEYNPIEKVIYANNYSDAESYDMTTLNKISSYGINNLDYTNNTIKRFSCPTNSTKVAVLARDNIYVFDNKFFQNKITIPYNSGTGRVDYFCMTNNGLIAIARTNTLDIVSVSEKKVVASLSITDYPDRSMWACISMSKDGNYLCVVTAFGIKLYNYSSGTINLIYSDKRNYRSAMFDPNYPSRLLLTFFNNSFLEIRNASDFSDIGAIALPKAEEVIRNFDPETGNLMITDYFYLYILNMNSRKIIFKIPITSNEYNPLLYGNTIFSNTGYVLNIANYLTN